MKSSEAHTTRTGQQKAGNVSVYRTDIELPFGLAIAESDGDEQVLVELREGNTMTGVIANDSPASREWAEHTYDEYRAAATPVTPAAIEDVEDVEAT